MYMHMHMYTTCVCHKGHTMHPYLFDYKQIIMAQILS